MWPTFYIPLGRRVASVGPARFYLTTPPYPYQLSEAVTSAAEVDSVTPGINAEDEIETTAQFVSGTLVTRLRTQDGGYDEVETAAMAVGGALVVRLRTYDNRNDQVETTMQFVAGELKDPLVVYNNWPLSVVDEDITTTGSFVSGALS